MSSAPGEGQPGDLRMSAALVFAGGALGSVLRLAMSEATPNTFLSLAVVNLLGSLALGVVNSHSFFAKPSRQLVWGAGFCGGFTTFSSYSREIVMLLRDDRWLEALLYGVLSVALGVGGFVTGWALGSFNRGTMPS